MFQRGARQDCCRAVRLSNQDECRRTKKGRPRGGFSERFSLERPCSAVPRRGPEAGNNRSSFYSCLTGLPLRLRTLTLYPFGGSILGGGGSDCLRLKGASECLSMISPEPPGFTVCGSVPVPAGMKGGNMGRRCLCPSNRSPSSRRRTGPPAMHRSLPPRGGWHR